jgi:predicted RNA-binding Zn-ribbon protein involved in translation (DUF1610 family)
MAAPLPLRTYVCSSCGWKKHVTSTNDALIEGISGFRSCPKCGNTSLEIRASNMLEELGDGLNRLGDLLGVKGRTTQK